MAGTPAVTGGGGGVPSPRGARAERGAGEGLGSVVALTWTLGGGGGAWVGVARWTRGWSRAITWRPWPALTAPPWGAWAVFSRGRSIPGWATASTAGEIRVTSSRKRTL